MPNFFVLTTRTLSDGVYGVDRFLPITFFAPCLPCVEALCRWSGRQYLHPPNDSKTGAQIFYVADPAWFKTSGHKEFYLPSQIRLGRAFLIPHSEL